MRDAPRTDADRGQAPDARRRTSPRGREALSPARSRRDRRRQARGRARRDRRRFWRRRSARRATSGGGGSSATKGARELCRDMPRRRRRAGEVVEHGAALREAVFLVAAAEHRPRAALVRVGVECEGAGRPEPPVGADDAPAGERAGEFGDVGLRVAAADAERVQLHDLAREILVEAPLAFARRGVRTDRLARCRGNAASPGAARPRSACRRTCRARKGGSPRARTARRERAVPRLGDRDAEMVGPEGDQPLDVADRARLEPPRAAPALRRRRFGDGVGGLRGLGLAAAAQSSAPPPSARAWPRRRRAAHRLWRGPRSAWRCIGKGDERLFARHQSRLFEPPGAGSREFSFYRRTRIAGRRRRHAARAEAEALQRHGPRGARVGHRHSARICRRPRMPERI